MPPKATKRDERLGARKRGLDAQARGRAFEAAFQQVMERDMGFAQVFPREQMRAHDSFHPYECDLIGMRGSGWYRLLLVLALVLGLPAFLHFSSYVLEPRQHVPEQPIEDFLNAHIPGFVGLTWIVLAVVAVVAWRVGGARQRYVVLVECKLRGETLKRDEVHQLAGRVQDMRLDAVTSGITEVWLVASGFDSDAVRLATSRRIFCVDFRPGTSAKLLNPELESGAFRDRRGRLRSQFDLTDKASTVEVASAGQEPPVTPPSA